MRPGPELGETALRAMEIAKKQFGFLAANSYAPHVTLVGSIALDVPESALLTVLDTTLSGQSAVPLYSKGLGLQFEDSIGYNVNEDGQGQPNLRLRELVGTLYEALAPIRVYPVMDRGNAQRRQESAATFQGHLSVVGHDGADNLEVVFECLDYLKALNLDGPSQDPGDTVSLYRFHSEDWSGRYWETMQWSLVKSWKLG